jgi:transposase
MAKRRSYTKEFKEQAVQLVLQSGRSAHQIARELGLSQTVLSDWVRQVKTGVGETPTEELRRLREEVARLRMERDFLKKAAAFFAKESK